MASDSTLSLVATNVVATPGSTVLNVPTAASTTYNARNVRQKVGLSFSTDSAGHGFMESSIGSLPMILEMTNRQNHFFMCRSFCDLHSDYQLAKTSLATAKAENDQASISFYRGACCNLEKDLKAFEEAN